MCSVGTCLTPESCGGDQAAFKRLEEDYVVTLCRRTDQLRGLAYANFPVLSVNRSCFATGLLLGADYVTRPAAGGEAK